VRLREQAARFRVACDIAETFPESRLALQVLEAGIQTTAKRLSVATNIAAMSLEGLIDALEHYNTDVQMIALGRFESVSNKASRRERFFGRRQRRLTAMDEKPQEEEELANPMRREDWVRWLEPQRELELAGRSSFCIRNTSFVNTIVTDSDYSPGNGECPRSSTRHRDLGVASGTGFAFWASVDTLCSTHVVVQAEESQSSRRGASPNGYAALKTPLQPSMGIAKLIRSGKSRSFRREATASTLPKNDSDDFSAIVPYLSSAIAGIHIRVNFEHEYICPDSRIALFSIICGNSARILAA
jgi:hypothetical protein